MASLLPCPLCGSAFLMGQEPHDNHPIGGMFYLFHEYGPIGSAARNCPIQVRKHFATADEAISAWNSRDPIEHEVPWPGRKFCETAERNVLELSKWLKGDDDKTVASDAALAIKTLLSAISLSPASHPVHTSAERIAASYRINLDEAELRKWASDAVKALRVLSALSPAGGGDVDGGCIGCGKAAYDCECVDNDDATLSHHNTNAGEAVEWRCVECGCKGYARVAEKKPDGTFGDGPLVRCVECKTVVAHPPRPEPVVTDGTDPIQRFAKWQHEGAALAHEAGCSFVLKVTSPKSVWTITSPAGRAAIAQDGK